MSPDLTDNISGPQKIDPDRSIEQSDQQKQGPTNFDKHMQTPGQTGVNETSATTKPEMTPEQLMQQSTKVTANPTADSVTAQMKTSSGTLGDLQSKLNTPNLKLKPHQKHLLRNKLSNANSLISTATEKTGAKTTPLPAGVSRQNPIARFLSYVTNSQQKLAESQQQIQNIAKSGKTMSPGAYLLVQVKLNKAQQELEYSSVVLSKAVDDIKTLFNVQI